MLQSQTPGIDFEGRRRLIEGLGYRAQTVPDTRIRTMTQRKEKKRRQPAATMVVMTAGSVLCVAIAANALRFFCYVPYRCNQIIKTARPAALRAFDATDPVRAAEIARANAALLQPCVAQAATMIDPYMIQAVDYRVLGNLNKAAQLYRHALRYDRRPELYLQLGITELQRNHRDEARRALEKAILFNPPMIEEISDPELRTDLSRLVQNSH